MRLHRLEVTAFGPFAGTVEVDLDAVSAGGLFLIRGATGAGKTSLLDAVAFALYADVPGARSKKQLHSDHAERGTVPSVTLEFTASGRRLKIERSPEFHRPKSRGGGETKVQAKAVLWEHRGGQWVALSTRHDEVADVVKDVLGMGLEQFSKVVLLPQGDFAAFLRATPEERRELLQRLFDVSAFAGIEDWFAAQRKDSAALVAEHRAALNSDLAVLADVLADAPAVDGGSRNWSELAITELPSALAAARQSLDAGSTARLAAVDATRLSDAAATTAHATATETAARRLRGLAARSAIAALEAERDAQEARVARLELGERAASVEGDLKALGRVTAALQSGQDRAANTEPDVARWALAGRGQTAIDLVVDRLDTGGEALATAARVQTSLDGREVTRARLVQVLATARHEVERSTTTLSTHQEQAARATEALGAAQQSAAKVEAATARVAQASTLLKARRALDSTAQQQVQAESAIGAQRTLTQDLRDVYQDRRQARLDAMAGELASRLEQAQPCPVCGSPDHPSPAPSGDLVSAEDVAAAESTWQTAAAQLGAAERAAAGLAGTAAQLREQLGDEERDEDALAAALVDARHVLTALTSSAATLDHTRMTVESVNAAVESVTAQLAGLRAEATAAVSRIEALDTELATERAALVAAVAAHYESCPCAEPGPADHDLAATLADPDRLDTTTTHHEAAVVAATAHAASLRELSRATRDHDEVVAATGDSFRAAGFSDAAQARAGLLPTAEVAHLRTEVAAHVEAALVARTTLDEPGVLSALEAPAPEVATLAAARDAAHAAYTAAVAADTLVRRTLTGLDRVLGSLTRRCAEITEAEARHHVLRELADTVAGTSPTNALRMRLSAFVLAARLEKVATLANERLSGMGEGRYQLRHSDHLAARGARSGLGLEVLDQWTGQTRDTSSLSGGESFMASLALALGLADAVREESGGFDLQTLFVDEGFGTLDDESLEQVMAVLDDLREGGRAVGVVSHVAELRTRIPNQVVVRKTERGSSVQVTTTDEAAPAA
ncbi:AAA family ATPase [Pedococcus bigeumensis]|uniref:Nuclease SbcCD subunit C n=1 Tax=Pedococcus bigeumensis TaxID=433644 RepID=A0A502CZI1_9MICO|nr:SMC family ATPase [Pedococcus bigeumensis]TPG18042.1 SMC family ATPase [Pedococcus bigeumensis]